MRAIVYSCSYTVRFQYLFSLFCIIIEKAGFFLLFVLLLFFFLLLKCLTEPSKTIIFKKLITLLRNKAIVAGVKRQ